MGFLNKLLGGGKEQGQGMAAQLITQLTTDLSLSADQVTKIKTAFQSFRESRKTAKESGGDMKVEMREHRQELKNKILALLSDEQKQKFTANIEKYKDFFQR